VTDGDTFLKEIIGLDDLLKSCFAWITNAG